MMQGDCSTARRQLVPSQTATARNRALSRLPAAAVVVLNTQHSFAGGPGGTPVSTCQQTQPSQRPSPTGSEMSTGVCLHQSCLAASAPSAAAGCKQQSGQGARQGPAPRALWAGPQRHGHTHAVTRRQPSPPPAAAAALQLQQALQARAPVEVPAMTVQLQLQLLLSRQQCSRVQGRTRCRLWRASCSGTWWPSHT